MVSARTGTRIEKVDKAINLITRGVLSIWRITATVCVLQDAELIFRGTALEYARIRFAMRMRTVNATHPLVQCLATPMHSSQRATKLRLLDAIIQYAPLPIPPLNSHQNIE